MSGPMSYKKVRQWCHEQHRRVGQDYEGKSYGEGHLDVVASFAIAFGFGDDIEVMMSCQAHDVPEDTGKSIRDMYNVGFPATVCAIVDCLSDPKTGTREEKKKISLPRIASNRKSIIVKLCDRGANGVSSRKNKPEKFRRYCLEYPEFRAALYDPSDFELAPLWSFLDGLFGFKQS